jgi:hypothetical protein
MPTISQQLQAKAARKRGFDDENRAANGILR